MEFRRVLFRSSNLLFAERDIPEETEKLVSAIRATRGPLIFVANEVGLGIVPDNALARRFRAAAGTINPAVAHAVQEAVFMTAGLPLRLQQRPNPRSDDRHVGQEWVCTD